MVEKLWETAIWFVFLITDSGGNYWYSFCTIVTQGMPTSLLFQNLKKQDKVNYAVSEREDGVTGVTKFTRMAGCTRLYRAVLYCTKLYWALLFWQRLAGVIGFQKMYGLCGLNHHIKKKMCDVTPVTKRRTEESRK